MMELHQTRGWGFSSLFFTWAYPIVRLGQNIRNNESTLPLPADLKPNVVHPKFRDALTKKGATLVDALHSVFAWKYYPTGLLKLLADISGFGGPLVLNLLVKYVDTTHQSDEEQDRSLLVGLGYVAMLVFSTLVQAVFSSQFWFRTNCIGLSVRAALVSQMYEKCLNLGATAGKEFTPGQVLNLTSTDIDRLLNFFPSFHELWSLPIQIVVGTVLLYQQLGVATFAALILAVLLAPANRLIAVRIGRLSENLMQKKDVRVALTSAALHNAYFIKLKTLGRSMVNRIRVVRSQELRYLTQRKYLDALCVYFWASTPVVMSLVTFAVYVRLGGQLDSAQVFTSIALFNMMLGPINSLPWVINGLVEANVSRLRIAHFLSADGFDPSTYFSTGAPPVGSAVGVDGSSKSSVALQMAHSSFAWPTRGKRDTHTDLRTSISDRTSNAYNSTREVNGGQINRNSIHYGPDHGQRNYGTSLEAMSDASVVDESTSLLRTPSLHREGPPRLRPQPQAPEHATIALKDVSLTIERGQVVVVTGPVGSGKTSLVNAIMGCMLRVEDPNHMAALLFCPGLFTRDHPHLPMSAGIGYAAQIPFLKRDSILDNIVFGRRFSRERYMQVLYECDLVADIQDMRRTPTDSPAPLTSPIPGVDISSGEQGSHLSGGQRARVALARALYGEHLLYILDDPLAALDGPVAMTIVKRILLGSLRDKAVLFITHNTGYFKGVSDSAPVTTEQRLPPQRATAAQVHSHSQSSPEPIGYSATRGTTPGDSGAVPDSKNWALPPNGGSSGAVQDSNDRTMPPNTASDNVSRIPESEQAAITPLPCHKETPTTVPNQNVNGIPVETSAESPSLTHSKHSQPVGSCRVAGEAFTRQLAYYAMEDGRLTMQQRGESVLVSDACAADSGQVRTADDSRGVEPTDITGPNMPCPEVSGNRTAGDVLDSPGSDAEEEALEECESGVVHRSVYRMYAVEMGLWLALAVFVSMTGMQVTRQLTDWWLGIWASAPDATQEASYYLRMYVYLAVGNGLFTLARSFLFAAAGLVVARRLHDTLLVTVMGSTLTYLSSTSIGRVLNRFSTDTYDIDDSLPFILNIFLANLFGCVGMISVIVLLMPSVGVLLIPVAVVYYKIQCIYRQASREVKRLETMTRSPIYTEFSDAVDGADTIRVMRLSELSMTRQAAKITRNQRAAYVGFALSQWLTVSLQLLGIVFVTAVGTVAVVQRNTQYIHQGLVGLSLTYTLGLISTIGNVMTSFTQTEIQMIAVERVKKYITEIPLEETAEQNSLTNDRVPHPTLPNGWPRTGTIEFRNVTLDYPQMAAADTPVRGVTPSAKATTRALDKVSFSVKDGQRYGICGRTGAGKSSLIAAAFRLAECTEGRILIDGVDISTIPLHILRGRMGIITQTAVLFKGTVRQNLDPFSIYSSGGLLISALKRCHIWERLQPNGLDTQIDSADFSAGEKQLICIAAGIVNDAKIWWIDEATASLDIRMDNLVQAVIRDVFRGKTVITIAHRYSTIADSDRILTMERGQLVDDVDYANKNR